MHTSREKAQQQQPSSSDVNSKSARKGFRCSFPSIRQIIYNVQWPKVRVGDHIFREIVELQSSRNPCFEHSTDPHTLLRLVLSSCNMRELKHVLSELGCVMDLYRNRQEQLSIAYNVISNRNVTCNGSSSAQFYKSDAESKAGIMNYGRCVNNSHNTQSLAASECSSVLSNW